MLLNKYLFIVSALVLLLFTSSCSNRNNDITKIPGMDRGLLFAHRGVVINSPENTLESAKDALDLGFKALELDLRKSSDNKWMLFHDADGKRLLGIDSSFKKIPTCIFNTTPLIFNGKPSNSYIVSLSEFLKRHNKDFIFYFDVKETGLTEADEIADTIIKYSLEKRVIVASADVSFILYFEWKHPELYTALEGMNSGKEWTWKLIPMTAKPDFLSGFLDKIDAGHITWLKENNLLEKRIVYGVDSTNYEKARHYGIKHLIVDYYPGMTNPM